MLEFVYTSRKFLLLTQCIPLSLSHSHSLLLGAEIKFSLSGESVEGVHAPASINAPVEPRLFVLQGNGYGYELMRDLDVQEYHRGLRVMQAKAERTSSDIYTTPAPVPRIQIFSLGDQDPGRSSRRGKSKSGAKKMKRKKQQNSPPASPTSMGSFATATTTTSDPTAHVHVVSCNLTAGKTALSAAQGFERGEEPELPLTLKEKSKPILSSRRVTLIRQLIEVPSQSKEAIQVVKQAEKSCEKWRDDRDSNQGRFDVADPRPRAALEAERAMANAILASRKKEEDAAKGRISELERPASKSELRRAAKRNKDSKKEEDLDKVEPTNTTFNEGAKEEEVKEDDNEEKKSTNMEQEGSMEPLIGEEGSEQVCDESEEYQQNDDTNNMSFPKAPLPDRKNIMSYTSSSTGGNVIGLSDDVRKARGLGGFWRDQNPDISAPTSKQMTSDAMDDPDTAIEAILEKDDNMMMNNMPSVGGKKMVS